jgi:hypothetical protein
VSPSLERIAFQACLIDRSSISPSVESTTYGHSQSTTLCDCDKASKSDFLTFSAIKHTVMNAGLQSAVSPSAMEGVASTLCRKRSRDFSRASHYACDTIIHVQCSADTYRADVALISR